MTDFLQRVFSLSRIVLLDGLRRHALLGLVVMALALQACGFLFVEFIPRDIGRAVTDFILSITWSAGLLLLLFHAVNTVSWDDERRVIHTILARPISRSEYVLGLFLGLAQLLLLLNLILGGLGLGVLQVIYGMVSESYFASFSVGYYILAVFGIFLSQLAILAVIFLFSGMVRGAFTVLLMTISYYLTCNGLPVVRQSIEQKLALGQGGSEFLMTFLKWLTTIFPDFSRFDYKRYVFAVDLNPDFYWVAANSALLLLYALLALWGSCAIYRLRDLK